MCLVLAQSTNAAVAFNEMLPGLGLMVLIVFLGLVFVFLLRRHLFGASKEEANSVGVMSDLRAMRDRGEMTEDEYERTRAVMIARATGKDPEAVRTASILKQGGVVAKPGFDLTGRPLPKPEDPDSGEDV